MKNALLILSIVGTSLATPEPISAQKSKKPHQHHRKTQPDGMQSMMPMMMEMHRRHAAMANAWAVGKRGVFVVRSGQLLKYDAKLKVVKSVDLPKDEAMKTAAKHRHKTTAAVEQPAKPHKKKPHKKMAGKKAKKMAAMMARMHGRLPVEIRLTDDAVFVSQDNKLFKYDHDLKLQAQAELPPAKPMECPMCKMMMQRMRKKMQSGHKHPRGNRTNRGE